MLAATVVSGRMTSASAAVRLVALSYFRGSALGRAAAEAAATAAGVPVNHSSPSRSSSSTILMQLGDLPTSELGCTTENMSCRKIVAGMQTGNLAARAQPPRRPRSLLQHATARADVTDVFRKNIVKCVRHIARPCRRKKLLKLKIKNFYTDLLTITRVDLDTI